MQPREERKNYGSSRRTQDNDAGRINLNFYPTQPDYQKTNALKNRLYDSGISSIPMPSVDREIERNISSRPYSAKMNPNKITSQSRLKKRLDSVTKSIYSNLQDSYKDAAAQEAKYKGEGTAQYYKAQHVVVPPPRLLGPSTSVMGTSTRMSMTKSGSQSRLVPRNIQSAKQRNIQSAKGGRPSTAVSRGPRVIQSAKGPRVDGTYSTNKILLNKGPTPGKLPDLSNTPYGGFFPQTDDIDPNMRLLQGPPATVMTGFEGGYSMNQKNLELARSKFLIDKLTGKLPPDGRKSRKLPPLSDSQGGRTQRTESDKQSVKAPEDQKQEDGEDAQQVAKRGKWSDLDKFIELLLDCKSEEETVFVYLNPNPNNDPYDLLVCSYQERKSQKYYTLSGKGLTLYENDTPIEFLSLGQWLIERDSYNHIKELNFFKKFKKWKFMRMWKKTIKHQNRMKAQNSLEEKLFVLQDHFSVHLQKHRQYMIEMQKQRFIDSCQSGNVVTIGDFADMQLARTKAISDEIQRFSDRCRENIRECISKVLSELRTRIISEIALDEERKKNNPIKSQNAISMKRKASSNVFEKLGFPPGMTYGHRSSLRKECSRFLRFAFLVDFLSYEALANIYLGSVRDMIDRLSELDEGCNMDEVMEADYSDPNAAAGGGGQRGKEPLFYVCSKLCDEVPIPSEEIKEVQIDDFVMPPRGTSKVDDFDLLAHLKLQAPTDEDEEEDEFADVEPEAIEPIFRKLVPNIEKFWLKMEPDEHDYIEVIIRTFGQGLEQIRSFERWSKHNDLTPYADALEEWDEKVGDNWDEPDSLKLDPKTWIQEDPLYLNQRDMVTDILSSAFEKMRFFLSRFAPLLEIYWRNKQADLNILVDETLVNPIECIQNTIRLFNHYHEVFNTKLPRTADIGLIQLDSKSSRSKIQPTPKKYIAQLEQFIPEVIRGRNDKSKKWLDKQIRDLSKPDTGVEDFVEQNTFYNYANEHFQEVRDRVDMYGQVYNVLKEFSLKVKKEDTDAFNDSLNSISRLQTIMQEIESQQEDKKNKYKKIVANLVPKLDAEINTLFDESQDPKYLDGANLDKMYDIIQELAEKEAKFKQLEALKDTYNNYQMVLETQLTVFENLEDCREQIVLRCLMWNSLDQWTQMNEKWNKTQFSLVDAPEISKMADIFTKHCMRLEKNLAPNPIQEKLKTAVVTFKEAMPIVTALRNEMLGEHHWAQIKGLIKKDFDIAHEDFTLEALIELEVNQFQEEITSISTQATQEHNLRSQLAEIEELYKKTSFEVKQHEKIEAWVLGDATDLYQVIDDTLANINMILGSRFVKPLREEAELWKKNIMTLSDMVEEWYMVQRGWMYLENIFTAPDIKKAMPIETKAFEGVDKNFKMLMTKTQKAPSCIKIVRRNDRTLDDLKNFNAVLDEVQKKLEDYMEMKRKAFPRFYFLSNDELIDILANSQNMEKIQKHLKTCFDNIVRIDIKDDEIVEAMNSNEKEKVPFKKPVKARGLIEDWLSNLQTAMTDNLQMYLKAAQIDYGAKDRTEFVKTNFGQIVATTAQIMWCSETETAISNQYSDPLALQECFDANVVQIEALTKLVCGELTELIRKVIVALVTTDVHARDIVEELKVANVQQIHDFNWQKQLRYYWEEEIEDCRIKQVSATLNYGYEYMGATSRLVITPLTDRCWITISNALHIKLGANPAGPAGTGKTESTKDLAKAIAIQCIVFNCSDQVDYIMMGRLFSGLCQQGCWTCLDEFNRIDIEVLSVIAQQLLQVRVALLEEKSMFTFEEMEIPLKPYFGCHVTMNPGYAGRTELPDNLKVLFRPVAMMIPNYGLIAEIMLGAEGFANARQLSTKMVQLYKLSSEQLSQQDHYDFGLRAVKSVLVMAGSLKRANPQLNEDDVLIRAMRDANVPKFLKDDLPLFAAIIQDLFPASQIEENDYGALKVTIEDMIDDMQLQKKKEFIIKVIQLFETFNVRFGVMLVGPTGSGKTTCYQVLQNTMTHMRETANDKTSDMFQIVKKIVLNPKAISMGEMYGYVDEASQEWFDGLASKVMRNAAAETDEEKTWVVFDGPVDALWIENMNTVLDDNMTLCLANGQRIKLRSQMRMLFEVQDLAVASPATVSRCGMVYLTTEELGWRPYVQSWLQTFFTDFDLMPSVCKEHLWTQFDLTIEVALEFIRSSCVEPVVTTDLQQVISVCNFIEYFIDEAKGFKGPDEDKKKLIDCIFAWSYAWGIGGSLEQRSKEKFDTIVRDQFKSAQIPASFTVFDYWYDLKKEKVFKNWTQKVVPFVYDKDASFFDLMVPTVDTTKYAFCLESLLSIEKPSFFTGNSGVGKSVVIQNQLQQIKEKGALVIITINMSAQTTSEKTQTGIQEKLEKKKRTILGAVGKKVAVFVDDINMPTVETYGAQPPIEFLRLFLDRKGLYERGEWTWKDVEDTTVIACAAPPSGGRAVITQRLSRRFNMFCLPEASQGTLSTIFSSIMKGFLSAGNFSDKIKNLEEASINSTIAIYIKIQEDLRPTPSKFHYLFNLRDVSKVVQGICMSKAVSIQTPELFMKLWTNESTRVFYDRLINDSDREWFKNLVMDLLSQYFKMSPEKDELFGELRFGDLLKLDSPGQNYEFIADKPKLLKGLYGSLDEYNMSNSNKMNLVLFDDALEHVLRIARCLKQPRGHIMLIGVGGSGKQSLLRLCTYMRSMEYKSIEITKNYGVKDFKETMKGYMKEAGIGGQGISFVMTDTQIIDETFIENLNNLLNTGEIPNLMAPEDKDEIANELRPICTQKKIVETIENINNLFIDRVREYLHICLCMSPVGETLRVRCRQFPSLVNCCTLDWFSRWPEQALLYVSNEFLKDLPETSDAVKTSLAEMCMRIHISVEEMAEKFYDSLRRRVYTTPKSYLDLISLYLKKLEEIRNTYEANQNRLSVGLNKLNETNMNIAELKIKIEEMQPKLLLKNEELKVALVQVNADKAIADEKEKVVSADAEIVNKKAADAKEIADDAEADLAAAKPELQAAQDAVKKLEKNSIVEIKAFTQPPEGVKFVMEAVMVLLQERTDWKVVKQVLGNPGEFMQRLLTFDVDGVSEKVWKKARDGWIHKPQFEPVEVRKVSLAAAALCTWAVACSRYQIVVKKVAPKKKKLAEVTSILNEAQAELQVKLDMVQKVKDKVAQLEADCQKMQDEKEDLEFLMDQSTNRMRRAEKLVVLLKDEGVRWAETVEVIKGDIERLVGDVFLSCACISYFGAFTGQYREQLVNQWLEGALEREIPSSEGFSLVKTMGDPVVLRNWNIAGLPSDQVSSENGILTMVAERYSLCIDPQQQANKWIKNMEKNNNLLVLKFGPEKFLQEITFAVRCGRPCLVEDLEEFTDPAIDPILLKQQFKSDAGIMQIRLGDSNVDYDENFKFFMTTKLPNPHYIPEICIKVTLINFTVTFDGLQQQMLGDVVIAEKPEIEAKRDQIVLTMAADAATLKDLENNILNLLKDATLEQILDEDTLIDILENSKKTSGEINERMEMSKVVEVEINETRNLYTDVAIRGSILYFVIADLGGIDPMYQNSLAYVKSLFNRAIEQAPKESDIDKRILILIDKITRMIYTNISRGLFEKDKMIYSFLISTSILRNAQKIDEAIWNIFLRGPTVMTQEEAQTHKKNPDPAIMTEINWDSLYSAELRSQGQFEKIQEHVIKNWATWQKWATDLDPYSAVLPGDYQQKLSNFDKLLLVKVFRPEMIQISMTTYIINEMEKFYIEPPPTGMNILFENIDQQTPLIFILSQGADPTSQLLKFAGEMNFMDKLNMISLGQGQNKKAENLIQQAHAEGQWVMLQNCHLYRSWMPELEKIVLQFPEKKLIGKIHEDFRLFLTSMPAPYFPVSVLQNSVKLTTEPPRGMKANLKRSWANLSQDFIDGCQKPVLWRKLLFSFSFFHAVIQERRKFGPLGWNIRYEFNDSDLETSFTMLKLFLDSQDDVPWDALLFVTGHINYGGRVTDDNDRRCLISVLEKYCQVDCLKDGYKYTPSGLYYAPNDGTIEFYREYIETLPINDNPEIFGLHDNANITFQAAESMRIIETILSIQPRVAQAAGGMTPDEIVLEKAKGFLDALPEPLNPKEGLKELFLRDEQGLIPSLSTVLLQEVEKFNRLLKKMNRSLIDIDLAIKGFIVMSEELDSMYLKIQNNQVPMNWSKVGYPSLKPLSSWFKDLLQRVEFMDNWLKLGNPASYWLPGMFFPQGFMTGVLQTHARQYKIAIDKLSYAFKILEQEGKEEIDEKPDDGVFIYGLFIDGARWDRQNMVIADQYPARMTETMPVVWFIPMEDQKPDPDEYQAPLYKTSVRAGVLSTTGQSTNFIVHVAIPANENPNVWVQRGAAMLCMLND